MGYLITFVGGAMTLIGMLIVLRMVWVLMLPGEPGKNSWFKIISKMGISVFFMTSGTSLLTSQENAITPELEETTPEPVSTITLPEINNLETLLIIPIVAGTLTALWFTSRAIYHKRQHHTSTRAEVEKVFKDHHQLHNGIKERFSFSQTIQIANDANKSNWMTFFDYPALSDITVPETAAFIDKLSELEYISHIPTKHESAPNSNVFPGDYNYPKSVRGLESAWNKMQATAKKIGFDNIPDNERKLLNRAQHALTLANSASTSTQERQLAYNNALDMLSKLRSVNVPESTMNAIESSAQLMLTETT